MEEKKVVCPYYIVWYIDDEGKRHLATVEEKDKFYIEFLKDRYIVTECTLVKE